MENKLEIAGQNSLMDNFVKTDNVLNDVIAFIHFINVFLKFSTQRVENLERICPGLIIVCFCR